MSSTLMTLKEAAPLLRSAEITLRRKAISGELPHRKIGKRYFVTESDIEKYLQEVAKNQKGAHCENTN